jgi:hypothetical protein
MCIGLLEYFLSAVKKYGGCPRRIRADAGTENAHVEQLQKFFRNEAGDCFLTGKSTANQRIEWFWGLLRKELVQFYINLFLELKDSGYFDGSQLDKYIIQYCFMEQIQVG